MRKGQAAMEFLMTYGWAILVVLAAIGALAYFGVLSPDKFLPDKCSTIAPFTCTEWRFDKTGDTGGTAVMVFKQNTGYTLTNWTVNMTGTTTCNVGSNVAVANGDAFTVTLPNCNFTSGSSKFKNDFIISYYVSDGSIWRSVNGNLQTKTG
jgi:hypothetical protein